MRPGAANIVQFENVGLRYGAGAETLSDISFSLETGAFYFLTGPSGAGKSSLLRLIYLAQRPSRGLIRMFGEDVVTLPRARMPGFRRRIGTVFQDFRLIPHLSAYENIALPLRVNGVAEADIDTPVREMLDWVGLSARAYARPATLSGGEQQRVAIARAVIGRPEVLVADEPTGNVDPEMAERLLYLFVALNKLGTTILVATHDLHLVPRVPHAQIVRLDNGRLAGRANRRRRRAEERLMALFGHGSGTWLTSAAGRRLLPEGWLSGPMPWVIAIMMFLMVLAAATGLALGFAAHGLGAQLSGQVTIQIVDADQARRDDAADRIGAAVGKIRGVTSVRRISDREMTELLQPWLGAGLADNDLPVPAMIDVAFDPAVPGAPTAAKAAVRAISPRARIDAHGQWLTPLAGLIGSLRWLAGVLVLLMAAAAAFTVVLAARAALNTHQATIDVMHHLGSSDAQIARLFQRRIATDALFGGMVGLLLASLVIFAVGDRIAEVGSDLLGSVDLPVSAWGVLGLLPLAGTLLAMVAARLTIIMALRRRL